MLTVACMLYLVLALVKWINMYFRGDYVAPYILAHLIHLSYTASSLAQVSSVESPYAKMFVSSTKPIPIALAFSISGRRVRAK